MAQDWDIKPRGTGCRKCGGEFADRQLYYSALVLEGDTYERGDFCEPCWASRPPESGAAYSQWKGRFRMPPPPPEEPLKRETAESLLRKLIEDADPVNRNVIYILAVMLERKRILSEKEVQKHDNDALVRVYEHRKSGEVFLVADPGLRLDQLEQVQEQVVVMLGGKPRGAEAAQAAQPAPAESGAAQAAPVEP